MNASTPGSDSNATTPGSGPSAVDTHCHLFLLDRDPAAVVAEARVAGVERIICVGIDAASSRRSLEMAESFPGVFATAGVHPHTASDFDDRASGAVEELLGDPRVVAVGETGLDYFRKLSPVEDQQRAFRTHIALSRETGKPLVVHIRDAWEDAFEILRAEGAERVVLHCFTGDAVQAKEAEARGYVVSFAGNLTYPNALHMREAAGSIGMDRIVVETDSPFLAPQSRRGTDNQPGNAMEVIRSIAEIRGVDPTLLAAATTANALRAFPIGH